MRYDNLTVGKVEATITAVVRGVSEKYAWSGTGCEFMRCGDMTKAQTPEHTEVEVCGVVMV